MHARYLRRFLFPVHKDLRYAGLLNPLDCPHHPRATAFTTYREVRTLVPQHLPQPEVRCGRILNISLVGAANDRCSIVGCCGGQEAATWRGFTCKRRAPQSAAPTARLLASARSALDINCCSKVAVSSLLLDIFSCAMVRLRVGLVGSCNRSEGPAKRACDGEAGSCDETSERSVSFRPSLCLSVCLSIDLPIDLLLPMQC